jgi:hypothetical protein
MFKRLQDWITGLFKDESGTPSSKRFIGILSGVSLCGALFVNLFTEKPVDPSLVNAVTALAFGALGLASVDKIWGKRPVSKPGSSIKKEQSSLRDIASE